jgi:hypothetical protein
LSCSGQSSCSDPNGASSAPINTATNSIRMAVMDVHDEHDDEMPDNDAAEGDEATYRSRAAAELDQIARQTKQTLVEADIDIDVFFLIPSSGNSVLIFGTPGDPDDDLWSRVSDVVGSVLRNLIGLDRVRCRQLMCAATDSIADHQPTESPAQPSEPSGCQPVPMPASALQHAGAEVR